MRTEVEQAELKLKRARSWMAGQTECVGLASMVLHLPLVCRPDIPTMATDGYKIYYSPKFVNEHTEMQIVFVLAHEGSHVSRGHHLRIQDRNPTVANVAADYSINGDLLDARIGEWVEGGLTHPEHSHSGAAFEAIYAAIYDEVTNPPQPPQQGQGDEGDEDEGDESDDSQGGGGEGSCEDGEDESDDEGDKASTTAGKGGGQESEDESEDGEDGDGDGDPGGDGQGNGSNSQPGQENTEVSPEDRPEMPRGYDVPGEIWPAPPDVDHEEARRELVERLAEAAMLEKAVGSGRGGICAKIFEDEDRSQPWEFLREFLSSAFSAEHTWKRANRRHIHRGVYLPGTSKSTGVLHIVRDTSGSVGAREHKFFFSNIRGIAEQLGLDKIRIADVDSYVNENEDGECWTEIDIRSGEEITYEYKGGGGTSFDPIFRRIEEDNEEVQALVYMTDGWGDISVEDPGFPVVWLTTGQTPWGHSWGEIVDISDEVGNVW